MQDDLNELLAQTAPPKREKAEPPAIPKGWEPGFTWDGNEGTITTGPLHEPPDSNLWGELIADWDLDPGTVEIIGPVRFKGWDSQIKGTDQTVRLKSYSVNIIKKAALLAADRADIEAICKVAMRRKWTPNKAEVSTIDKALVIPIADLQIGKGEGGGSVAAVERINTAMSEIIDYLKLLKKLNRLPEAIYVVGMGDLGEGCSGFYPNQQFTVDLNRREQLRVVRRLLWAFIDELIQFEIPIVLGAVPGNHGENRNDNGKAFTTVDDNDDLAVFEQVAEVMAGNPERYANVTTMIADDYTMTLDIGGVPICFFHGHVTSGGTSAAAKLEKWWIGQIVGMREGVKDAKILVSAHFHHLLVIESIGRTHLQCPAMDGGSHWYSSATGRSSPSGMMTFMAGNGCGPRGWDELRIF